jgi:hypothetical protein
MLNMISRGALLVLWSIYLTVGIVKWSTVLASNVPLFETCTLYLDGESCYGRYLSWLCIVSTYMVIVNTTDFAKMKLHS